MSTPQSKEAALIDSVITVVGEVGLETVSMAQILEHAGVGAGTVYRYFDGKDGLLLAAYQRCELNQLTACSEGDSRDGPWPERVEAMAGRLLKFLVENPDQASYIDQYAVSPVTKGSSEREVMASWAALVVFFGEGVAKRYCRGLGVHGSIAATFGMVGGVAFEIRSSDLTPKARLLKAVPRAVRAMLCGDK
ncbi:MAG: TetR/AcrR family transcriptional regulator [Actinobacteria bacterium]|nr:TetR/AcrR family transcriptional regulator [Actinomycetota bacterium]